MHPGFIGFWKHAQRVHGGCGGEAHAHGGPHSHSHAFSPFASASQDDDFGGGGFGVRRPLRFLAHKLELEETQVEELAAVLNELKTDRAQAAVDLRRTTTSFADIVQGTEFDQAKADAVANDRVKATQARENAVSTALGKIHRILNDDQRKKLSYLLRTGALSI